MNFKLNYLKEKFFAVIWVYLGVVGNFERVCIQVAYKNVLLFFLIVFSKLLLRKVLQGMLSCCKKLHQKVRFQQIFADNVNFQVGSWLQRGIWCAKVIKPLKLAIFQGLFYELDCNSRQIWRRAYFKEMNRPIPSRSETSPPPIFRH